MINNYFVNSESNKILIQGNVISFALFQSLVKITQSDIELAKQEWLDSAGRFAYLLLAKIPYGQTYRQDSVTTLYRYDSEDDFYFDPKLDRYYYLETNRAVANSTIEKLLNNRLELARQELSAYENALLSNRISLESFQEASGKGLKSLYLQNYALGKGGFDRISTFDLAGIESTLNTEIDRVRRASEAIRQQQLSKKQLSAVLNNTAGAGRSIYYQGRKDNARETGKGYAQRFLGNTINDRHCPECLAIVARGVQPIDQVPVPGDQCRCSFKCKCSIMFYRSLEEQVKN